MLEKLLKELNCRGFKSVEIFARIGGENNPSGSLDFYLKHEFEIIRQRGNPPYVSKPLVLLLKLRRNSSLKIKINKPL